MAYASLVRILTEFNDDKSSYAVLQVRNGGASRIVLEGRSAQGQFLMAFPEISIELKRTSGKWDEAVVIAPGTYVREPNRYCPAAQEDSKRRPAAKRLRIPLPSIVAEL
jgi:hypothetical protein